MCKRLSLESILIKNKVTKKNIFFSLIPIFIMVFILAHTRWPLFQNWPCSEHNFNIKCKLVTKNDSIERKPSNKCTIYNMRKIMETISLNPFFSRNYHIQTCEKKTLTLTSEVCSILHQK